MLVRDPVRDELVMFSGHSEVADTWLFGDRGWTPVANSSSPARRVAHAMTTDPGGRVLLFGGFTDVNTLGDTWMWDRVAGWRQLAVSEAPSPRTSASMTFDDERGVAVLFGGSDATEIFGDTWEHDGTQWRHITDTGPPPQRSATLAYDPDARRVVMFATDGRTYSYDGTTWTQLASPEAPAPTARRLASLAFDLDRRRLVLIGGQTPDFELHDDAWELAGDRWVELEILGARPVARISGALAPLRRIRGLVLFGGAAGGSALGDTWFLQRQSMTPDEACSNAIDDDADHRVDSDDPDCAP